MICVALSTYSVPCATTTGGVSDLWIFDPADFNFTQTVAAGVASPYTAIALRPGATNAGGGKMFPLKFQRKEAEFKYKHTRNGCSVKYDYDLEAQLPNLSHGLTTYLMQLDNAGCCCGLGIVVLLNSGKIFVLGERFVNNTAVPYFEIVMNGTDGTSGKKFDDYNGAKVMFKGEYSRPPYEYSGTSASIVALQ